MLITLELFVFKEQAELLVERTEPNDAQIFGEGRVEHRSMNSWYVITQLYVGISYQHPGNSGSLSH